jgi:hypothetical protein
VLGLTLYSFASRSSAAMASACRERHVLALRRTDSSRPRFAGSNVFRASDAPRYKHGLIVCGACALAGAAVVLVWKVLYALQDRKLGRDESVRRNVLDPFDTADQNPPWA